MAKLTTCVLFVLAFGSVFGQAPSTPTPSQPAQTPPAQTTPAPTTTPPATTAPAVNVKAAQELVQMADMKSIFNQGKVSLIRAQAQANPSLAQFEDLMRQFVDKYLTWDKAESQYVNIYAESFSEPELRELIQLAQTPTGKKLFTLMPELMNRTMLIVNRQLQPHLPELQQQIMARVQEKQKQQQQAQPGQAQPGQPGQTPAPGQTQPGQQQPGQTQPGQQQPGQQQPGQQQPGQQQPGQQQPGQQQTPPPNPQKPPQ